MAVSIYFWFIHHSEGQVVILSSVYFGKVRSSWYYTNSEHLLTVHIYTVEIGMIVCFSNHSQRCIMNPMMHCKVLNLTVGVNTNELKALNELKAISNYTFSRYGYVYLLLFVICWCLLHKCI